MAGRGNPFSRDYSTSGSSESSLFSNPIPEEKGREHLYSVNIEVVNDLRRHTREYAKNIGRLPIIPEFPRREYKRKDRSMLEDLPAGWGLGRTCRNSLTGSCTTFEPRRS